MNVVWCGGKEGGDSGGKVNYWNKYNGNNGDMMGHCIGLVSCDIDTHGIYYTVYSE